MKYAELRAVAEEHQAADAKEKDMWARHMADKKDSSLWEPHNLAIKVAQQARLTYRRTFTPAQVLQLLDENATLRRERDAARRGIMELYHLDLITMSRARELMGFNHIDPVRELYKALKPEFDREFGDMGYAKSES